jgi:hypothetical protein
LDPPESLEHPGYGFTLPETEIYPGQLIDAEPSELERLTAGLRLAHACARSRVGESDGVLPRVIEVTHVRFGEVLDDGPEFERGAIDSHRGPRVAAT